MMPPSSMTAVPVVTTAEPNRIAGRCLPAGVLRLLRVVDRIGVVAVELGDQTGTDQRLKLRRQRVGAGLGVDFLAADVERERPFVLGLLGWIFDRGLGPGIERKLLD